MKQTNKKLDILGTTTSLMCAVHCATLPLLLSSGLIGTHTIMSHPAVEIIVLGLTAIFVYMSIWRPYIKHRKNPIPFALSILGFFMVLIHHSVPLYATAIVVLGGILIAVAHMSNLFLGQHAHKKA